MPLIIPFKKKTQSQQPKARTLQPFILERFRQALHTQQLDIFTQVLQFSLVALEDSLSKKILGQDSYGRQVTLFDKTVDSLYHDLVQLRAYLSQEGAWDRTPRRNLLLTIFVFYRSLFRDLLPQIEANGLSETRDNYSLIKRLPPQVIYQAGSEYWRLYELFGAVYGEIKALVLNQDLIEGLLYVFGEDRPSESQSNLAGKTSLPNTEASSQDIKPPYNATKEATAFIDWLEASILHEEEGFILNEGHVFIDTLGYESNILFITEACLSRYPGLEPTLVLKMLQETGALLGQDTRTRYSQKGDSTALIGIKVNHPIGEVILLNPCTILPLNTIKEDS